MSKNSIADKFIINLIDFIEFTSFLFEEYKSNFERVPTQSEYSILITVVKSMDKHLIIKTFMPKQNKELVYDKINKKDLDFFKNNQEYLNVLPEKVSEFININKIINVVDNDEYIQVFWEYMISFSKLCKKYEDLD